jgi:hypothetical protein
MDSNAIKDHTAYARWLEDKLLEYEPQFICDDMSVGEWCEKHCDFERPQVECLRMYYKEGVEMKEKYGEWVCIDNDPDEEDMYLVAWLPKGSKREECWIGLVFYDKAFGWDEEDIERIKKNSVLRDDTEIELLAWTPLPEMYRP